MHRRLLQPRSILTRKTTSLVQRRIAQPSRLDRRIHAPAGPLRLRESMALYQSPGSSATKNEKLIFAPTPGVPGSTDNGEPVPPRAGQFLQHEGQGGLRRSDLDPVSPITQFHAWFDEAKAVGGIAHPETCTLSTASLPSGRVSARIVYLKELDRQGFVLYSNFGTSRKGRDLFGETDGDGGGDAHPPNPWASLTFWWEALERQVRVEGRATRLPAAESQVYFDTRVRGSRIGAWASRQSAVLQPKSKSEGEGAGAEEDDGRAQLEQWVAEAEAKFGASEGDDKDSQIPVPSFWGGLRIVPERIEFWQGRQNRLHDRFVYDRVHGEAADGEAARTEAWTIQRLSP